MWRRYIDRYQVAVVLVVAIAYILISRFSIVLNSAIRFPIVLTVHLSDTFFSTSRTLESEPYL